MTLVSKWRTFISFQNYEFIFQYSHNLMLQILKKNILSFSSFYPWRKFLVYFWFNFKQPPQFWHLMKNIDLWMHLFYFKNKHDSWLECYEECTATMNLGTVHWLRYNLHCCDARKCSFRFYSADALLGCSPGCIIPFIFLTKIYFTYL